MVDTLLEYEDLIKSLDIVEFNPLNDINNKTEIIASAILQKFLNRFSTISQIFRVIPGK